MALAATPALTAPQTSDMPDARVDLAGQQPGHVGDQPAQGVDEVDGELRAGGVAARAR